MDWPEHQKQENMMVQERVNVVQTALSFTYGTLMPCEVDFLELFGLK
jgi:hypothetical protein